MFSKILYKKYISILLTFFSILNANSPFQDFDTFATTIKQAESFYLDPEKEKINLEEKLQILEQLYLYINQYKNFYQTEVPKIKDTIFLKEQNTYYLLTKEVIRYLEVHLKKADGWKEIDHFSRIAKPVTYIATASIILLSLFKLLEKFKMLPNKSYEYLKKTIPITATSTTALWITSNYKDEIL